VRSDGSTIYIMKGGRCVNKFKTDKTDWSLTIATYRVFPCTCEHMVSHLLPALVFGSGKGIRVKVIPEEQRKVHKKPFARNLISAMD